MFSIIEGVFGTTELNVPQLQIVGGETGFELGIFLNGLKLFLEPFRHSSSHLC